MDAHGNSLHKDIEQESASISKRSGFSRQAEFLQDRPAVPALHRGHVEIHRLEVADGDERKRRERRHLEGLQVARAGIADVETAILPQPFGRGPDESLAFRRSTRTLVLAAPTPAHRTSSAARAGRHDFRECRPRSAQGAVAVRPRVERRRQLGVGVRCQQRPLQQADERTDRELATSHRRSGDSPWCTATARMNVLVPRQGHRQQRPGVEARLDECRMKPIRGLIPRLLGPAHRTAEAAPGSRTRREWESARQPGPEHPALSLAARYLGGSDRRGSAALDRVKRGRGSRRSALVAARRRVRARAAARQ